MQIHEMIEELLMQSKVLMGNIRSIDINFESGNVGADSSDQSFESIREFNLEIPSKISVILASLQAIEESFDLKLLSEELEDLDKTKTSPHKKKCIVEDHDDEETTTHGMLISEAIVNIETEITNVIDCCEHRLKKAKRNDVPEIIRQMMNLERVQINTRPLRDREIRLVYGRLTTHFCSFNDQAKNQFHGNQLINQLMIQLIKSIDQQSDDTFVT
jgi:hypothetical protein